MKERGIPAIGQGMSVPGANIGTVIQETLFSAAVWDDEHPGTAEIDPPRPRREPGPRPGNSHPPWTEEFDAQLCGTWLAVTPGDPEPLLFAIAEATERNRNGIRARLVRVECDPDVPGRELAADHGPDDAESFGASANGGLGRQAAGQPTAVRIER